MNYSHYYPSQGQQPTQGLRGGAGRRAATPGRGAGLAQSYAGQAMQGAR